MRRREFITLLGGTAAAWPLAARGQQPDRVRRVGVLMSASENDAEYQAYLAAFEEGLQKLGWSEGRNIRIDHRWAPDVELMQRYAMELVGLKPDVILSQNTPTTAATLQQTRTIPIIFTNVSDPVGSGFVASLPRPGGNVTGFINMEASLGGKWLELLKEIAPRVVRVAFLFNPETATYAEYYLKTLKIAAASLAVEAIAAPVHNISELESTIAAQARESNCGLIVMPAGFFNVHRAEVTSLGRAAGRRIASATEAIELAACGRERGRAGASPSKPTPESVAARLDVDERLLLFCIASGTDWTRAGITKDALRASLAAIAGSSQGR